MTDLIKTSAVFIRANISTSESLNLVVGLDDMINCRTDRHSALSAISAITGRSFDIAGHVPNSATAFVLVSVRELRQALDEKDFDLAFDIADVLHSMPDKYTLHDKKAVESFNKVCIQPFNSKRMCQLPEIV